MPRLTHQLKLAVFERLPQPPCGLRGRDHIKLTLNDGAVQGFNRWHAFP